MGETVSTLLFQPPPPSKLKEHKIVWLDTSRGTRIPGFYISYRRQGGIESCRSLSADEIKDSKPQEGITILYSHANAEDLGSIYPWCKFLSKMLRVNLFAYDYTGYGMAMDKGPPSEEHCYADIEAAFSYLRDTLNVPPQNIVLYGRSLGSGPSCHMAAQTALTSKKDEEVGSLGGCVGGLILHAPFLSVFRVVVDTGCTLPGDKFPNLDVLPMVKSPTLLVHGTSDQIVPFHHSERLFNAIPEHCRARPLFIEGMSHNNVHSQVRPMFVDRVVEYLEEHIWPNVVSRSRSPVVMVSSSASSRLGKRIWKSVDADREESDNDGEPERARLELGL